LLLIVLVVVLVLVLGGLSEHPRQELLLLEEEDEADVTQLSMNFRFSMTKTSATFTHPPSTGHG